MTIRVYTSEMYNAPSWVTSPNICDVLDACLVNGLGEQTVTITNNGTIAEIVFPNPHGLPTGVGKFFVAGASDAEYNGEQDVTYVDDLTLSYVIANTPASPAVGTITAKVSPAGWTIEHTGTNKRNYKMGGGSLHTLSIDGDTSSTVVYARGLRNPTALDVSTHSFPTTAQYLYPAYNWQSPGAGDRHWLIIASDKHVYIINDADPTTAQPFSKSKSMYFGDFESYDVSDAYNCLIMCANAEQSGTGHQSWYISADPGGSNKSHQFGKTTHPVIHNKQHGFSHLYFQYNNTADGKIYMVEPLVTSKDQPRSFRGHIRGIWDVFNGVDTLTHGDTFEGSGDLAGKHFYCMYMTSGIRTLEVSDTY